MISIHNYTGETTGRKDISKAKQEFYTWADQKSFPEGATIDGYLKIKMHQTILRKLQAFGLIGNQEKNKD